MECFPKREKYIDGGGWWGSAHLACTVLAALNNAVGCILLNLIDYKFTSAVTLGAIQSSAYGTEKKNAWLSSLHAVSHLTDRFSLWWMCRFYWASFTVRISRISIYNLLITQFNAFPDPHMEAALVVLTILMKDISDKIFIIWLLLRCDRNKFHINSVFMDGNM